MIPLYWLFSLMIVNTWGLVGSVYRMLPAASVMDPARKAYRSVCTEQAKA